MALKPQDFLKKINEEHPNAVLDIEMDGEEVQLTLRNFLRLEDEEQKEVSEALDILSLGAMSEDSELSIEDLLKEILSEEEQEQTFERVMVERLVRALRSAAEDKELYDEFIDGLRGTLKGDFKEFIKQLFAGFSEETRLGEADTSGDS
ncbi:hypothetical protein Q7C18_02755 [Nesterenkonia sp. CL21]|uniref:hypothetical protein n=1 Tax=Nesterenkonia sp. CL21 TaxID=3064894 RepID=UPI002878CA7E|nr:hypothetical protein [Nesterenkonia sp. CL21]MDS2171609.1 hypothetical protein [Nesterenkonia sp. CL21]